MTRVVVRSALLSVAGAPTGTTEPCALSSPPIVISPSGSYPSIGGASVAQPRPTAPAPTSPAAPASPLTVTLPAKATVAALAAPRGLALRVRAPAAGRITVTGSVIARRLGLRGTRPIVVASGVASPKAAGTVTVRVRLKKTARKYRARLRGATLVLRVSQGGRTTKKSVRLR